MFKLGHGHYTRVVLVLLLVTALETSLSAQIVQQIVIGGKDTILPPWTGVLSPSRAIDWRSAGLPNGLPDTTWTQCGSTVAACGTSGTPVSASTCGITAAISACTASHYVQLGAGDFYLNTGFTYNTQSKIVVRGEGADQTFIHFSSDSSGGFNSNIGMQGSTSYPGNEQNVCDWTLNFTPGSTSINLANCGSTTPAVGSKSNLVAGSLLVLDQLDESFDNGTIWNCFQTYGSGNPNSLGVCGSEGSGDGNGGFSREDGTCNSSPTNCHRSQNQTVLVTNVSTSGCTGTNCLTVTISPGLYMPNWTLTQKPQAWWATTTINQDGLENLTLDNLPDTSQNSQHSTMTIMNCYQCWVHGIRSMYASRSDVLVRTSKNVQIDSSYFFENFTHQIVAYGIELTNTCDSVVANDIAQNKTSNTPTLTGPACGNAMLYNFGVNSIYSSSNNWLQSILASHSAGTDFNLYEGNIFPNYNDDNVHGTHYFGTHFRNHYPGYAPTCFGGTCAAETSALDFAAGSRYMNVVGNDLGQSTYHNTYQCLASPTCLPANPGGGTGGAGSGDTAVYGLAQTGGVGGCTLTQCTSVNGFCTNYPCSTYSNYDLVTGTSLFRWGNYDPVTGTSRYCTAASVPISACTVDERADSSLGGAAAVYPGLTNPNTTFPPSYYYSAQPAFMQTVYGTPVWPLIGPDVTGGNLSTHSNKNPAELVWENAPVDPKYQNTYSFTASSWTSGTETLTFAPNTWSAATTCTSYAATPCLPAGEIRIPTGAAAGTYQVTSVLINSGTPAHDYVSFALVANPSAGSGTMTYPNPRLFTVNDYNNSPLTYQARTDSCVHGYSTNPPTVAPFYNPANETCINGRTTGETGSALSYQAGLTDPLPFNSLASGTPAVANTSFTDPDFGSYSFFVTDQSTTNATTVWIMGSDGEYDAFGTGAPPRGNSADVLFSPQTNGSVPYLFHLIESRILQHTCSTTNKCAIESNIKGSAGYNPGSCVSPCVETAKITASGSVFSRNANDPPNTLYEVYLPYVYKDVFASHFTAGFPDGVGDTISRTLYVDLSTDTGGSIPCSIIPTDYQSQWLDTIKFADNGSFTMGSAGGGAWHASTAYTSDNFIQPVNNVTGITNYMFQATTAGTSGGTEPLWSTSCPVQGNTCTGDGGVTWTNIGKVNGQGPGFDIWHFDPKRGCRRINTRLAKLYNGTNEGPNWPATGTADPAGTIITDDTATCYRMGGTSCGSGGTVTLPDKSTIHGTGNYLQDRYGHYTPTGSGNVNQNYSGGSGDTTMSVTGNGSCTPVISYLAFQTWPNPVFVSGNSYTNGNYVTSPVDKNLYQLTGTTGTYTTDPSSDLSHWQYNSTYCYMYIIDWYTNITRPVLEIGPNYGADGHGVIGYGLDFRGGKYWSHYLNQPNASTSVAGPCTGSPANYVGAPNPGTCTLSTSLPADGHTSYRADGFYDLQPIPDFTIDVPMYGNSGIQSACGGGTGVSAYCAAGYGEIIAFSTDGLQTMYRFGHNYAMGDNAAFSIQNAIGNISQDGKLAAWGSDFMGTRGDHGTGSNTCVNPVRAFYQPTPGGTVGLNDQVFPVTNNSTGSEFNVYKAVGVYSGTFPSGSYVTTGSPWTETNKTTFSLTAAANASGGNTVYTGTITGGGSNALAGVYYKVAGFTNAGNDGNFFASASTTTTLTLVNSGGVAETHSGTAASNIPNWGSLCITPGQYCTTDGGNSATTSQSYDNGILWYNLGSNQCRGDIAIMDLTSAHPAP